MIAVLLMSVAIAATAWRSVSACARSIARLGTPLAAYCHRRGRKAARRRYRPSSTGSTSRMWPRRPAADERGDLAFVLWRNSPLARLVTAISAVVIRRPDIPPRASPDLPLTDALELDWRRRVEQSGAAGLARQRRIEALSARRWRQGHWASALLAGAATRIPGAEAAARQTLAAALLRGSSAIPQRSRASFPDPIGTGALLAGKAGAHSRPGGRRRLRWCRCVLRWRRARPVAGVGKILTRTVAPASC